MKFSIHFDRLRSRMSALIHDMVMIPAAWLVAYVLRFNLEPIPEIYLNQAVAVLPLVIVLQGATFWYFGLYRGVWRFASVPDLIRIFKAIVVGVSLSAIGIFFDTNDLIFCGIGDQPKANQKPLIGFPERRGRSI